MKCQCVTIRMKAVEQHSHVVLFIMISEDTNAVTLKVTSVDENPHLQPIK